MSQFQGNHSASPESPVSPEPPQFFTPQEPWTQHHTSHPYLASLVKGIACSVAGIGTTLALAPTPAFVISLAAQALFHDQLVKLEGREWLPFYMLLAAGGFLIHNVVLHFFTRAAVPEFARETLFRDLCRWILPIGLPCAFLIYFCYPTMLATLYLVIPLPLLTLGVFRLIRMRFAVLGTLLLTGLALAVEALPFLMNLIFTSFMT